MLLNCVSIGRQPDATDCVFTENDTGMMQRSPIAGLREIVRQEYFEPDASRALLVTVALVVPLIGSHLLEKPQLGILVGITAQLITSAKIRGPYPQRAVILVLGTLATGTAAMIGTLAGGELWAVILLMSLVAGLASLARGLGDYGQTLGICAVILFLISLRPPHDVPTAYERLMLVLSGGAWAAVLTLLLWPILPQLPLYLAIAKPWEVSYFLMEFASQPVSNDGESLILKQEAALTQAVSQVSHLLQKNYRNLAPFRREVLKLVRAASRFGATAVALHSELTFLNNHEPAQFILPAVHRAAQALAQAARAVSGAILSMRSKRFVSTLANIESANNAVMELQQQLDATELEVSDRLSLLRIATLLNTAVQYLRDAVLLLNRIEKKREGISPLSSFDLGFRLRPWPQTLAQWQPDAMLLRHSLRVMLVAAVGVTMYYVFNIPRGYWIVLTIMVVLQPDFGTTRQKSTERLLGTLAGAILGSLLLMHPFHPSFLVVAIAVCCFLFIYFQSRNYKLSVLFVTMMLVAMLEVAEPIDWHIAAYRLLSTAIGGSMAIAAAYLLWPSWERMLFPVRMAKAIRLNKNYLLQIGHELQFQAGFHARVIADRRKVEMENNNTLEALKRLSLEPGTSKEALKRAQTLAFHHAKLTRELTAFSAFLPGLTTPFDFPEANNLFIQCAETLEIVATAIEQNIFVDPKPDLDLLRATMQIKMHALHNQPVLQPENALTTESKLLNLELICSQLDTIAREITAMANLVRPNEVKAE